MGWLVERQAPFESYESYESYDYSEANKSSMIVWSEATFKEYLVDPSGKIPGTKMMFSDKNEQDIADLWAYLTQFGSDGRKK